VSLFGHFDELVIIEEARPLGNGCVCRVRLPDGSLEEAVISLAEAGELAQSSGGGDDVLTPIDPEKFRLLIGSARIRLAYTHAPQFAVSLSGIRTLPPAYLVIIRNRGPRCGALYCRSQAPVQHSDGAAHTAHTVRQAPKRGTLSPRVNPFPGSRPLKRARESPRTSCMGLASGTRPVANVGGVGYNSHLFALRWLEQQPLVVQARGGRS